MTLLRLLLRNLLYHRRGNAAVLLGVVVGAAVLTGALLVGDSLRGSLRAQGLRRLGWVDHALVAPRFFREALADELLQAGAADRVEPAVLLQGSASAPDGARARGVTVLGVRDSFFGDGEEFGGEVVWLNSALAGTLGVAAGDTVTLALTRPGDVPRESVLGRRDAGVDEWELTVGRVLEPGEAGDLFNLRPELEAPRNAYVPLAALQQRVGQRGRVNALLVGGGQPSLGDALRRRLRLDDWGLTLYGPRQRADALIARYDGLRRGQRDGRLVGREWLDGKKPRFANVIAKRIPHAKPQVIERREAEAYYAEHHPYLSLESRQLLIDRGAAEAALAAADDAGLRAAPTLVYLARIDAGKRRVAGVVAALDPAAGPPLGPFLPKGVKGLKDTQIVFVEEAFAPHPAAGSRVTLTYKPPEHQGNPPDRTAPFTLAGYVPLDGPRADPALTPEFPGITDKDDADSWELPFDDPKWETQLVRQEYDRVYGERPVPGSYWDEYRATPKAYVTLRAGQRLWGSPRFGELTSVRLAPRKGESLDAAAARFTEKLLARLDPGQGGFSFDPVRQNALEASAGGLDFAGLFLGFSAFLIAAALLLVGLLFRLNLDRRAREVGVLFAEGYRRRTVRGLLLGEGALLAGVGALLGVGLALLYSRLLLGLLAALWPGGVLRSFLEPHAQPRSLAVGGAASLLVSVLTIAWVVRALGKVPPRALLAGQTTPEGEPGLPAGGRWSGRVALAALAVAALLLAAAPFVPGHEAQAGTFFGSGALLLTAFLAAVSWWMRRTHARPVGGHGWRAVGRLGVRNAARHPSRSLLTAGLLAAAAFLVVAVEAFRRRADAAGGEKAPDGGFALLAESDLPVYRDLNTPQGRQEVLNGVERRMLAQKRTPAEAVARKAEVEKLLNEVEIVAFRVRAGDDASCLNLYQPRRPRVLGVPARLIERGGFTFGGTAAATPEEKANPWLLLRDEGAPVPAFGENNTVVWMLNSKLGGEVRVPEPLRVAGLLRDSVFQSSLLVSEDNFLKMYPGEEGYRFFLVRCPRGREDEVRRALEQGLADRGFAVTPTAQRLEAFLAVENTYLTTFQALGGLGLLLGSLGLAVVLLRGVWERRGELALLRALGYRRATLGWLVLAENGFLLALGLGAGALAALAAVAPHGAGVPWAGLLGLLGLVLAVGLGAGALAVAATLRAPLVPALRRE